MRKKKSDKKTPTHGPLVNTFPTSNTDLKHTLMTRAVSCVWAEQRLPCTLNLVLLIEHLKKKHSGNTGLYIRSGVDWMKHERIKTQFTFKSNKLWPMGSIPFSNHHEQWNCSHMLPVAWLVHLVQFNGPSHLSNFEIILATELKVCVFWREVHCSLRWRQAALNPPTGDGWS